MNWKFDFSPETSDILGDWVMEEVGDDGV